MARPKGSKNKVAGKSLTPVVKTKVASETIAKVPTAESETVINQLGDSKVITIGTNNQSLLKQLKQVKQPDKIMDGGFCSFTFDLRLYNLSFVPKRKRGKVA